jgi:transcriptional regulator of heat shock response
MITKIQFEKSDGGKDEYRKDFILKALIQEYTQTGEPVASQILNVKYRLGVSSATIRNHFVVLTEGGYLYKPYISSGRIPTDKAWKFFIERIFDEESGFLDHWEKRFENQFSKIKLKPSVDTQAIEKIKKLVEIIAEESHSFCFCYLSQENELIKQGLKYMFTEMMEEELLNLELIQEVAESLEKLDQKIKKIKVSQNPLVFIGKDNPFLKSDQFSSLLTAVSRPKSIFGILGPKRMSYGRNIAILKALSNLTS